jgi:hypothetical protein
MRETTKVFIGYTHEDAEMYERLFGLLLQSNLPSVTSFGLSSGDSLRSAIKKEISASDFLVILLSPGAIESSWIKHELPTLIMDEWRQRAITVIAVKVRPCKVPEYLADSVVLDAARDFQRGAQSLINLLRIVPLIDFDKLDARTFQNYVRDLLKAYRFKNVTRATFVDGQSYDLTAIYNTRDPFGRQEVIQWLIEVKAERQQTDISALRSFIGAANLRSESVRRLFVTKSQLTSAARAWLQSVRGLGELYVLEGTDLRRLSLVKPLLISKYFAPAAGNDHG